jgi:5'-phosphate synthase pdxT subunit
LPSILYSIDAPIALQGAFAEHFQMIQSLSSKSLTKTETPLPHLNPRLVQTKEDLDACNTLIIPGSESTTMAIVAKNMGLLDPLQDFVKVQSKPTWGTEMIITWVLLHLWFCS